LVDHFDLFDQVLERLLGRQVTLAELLDRNINALPLGPEDLAVATGPGIVGLGVESKFTEVDVGIEAIVLKRFK